MKRITVFTGNFGSGKTEIALNMALHTAKRGPVTLVDLDIVNPYFRSSQKKEMLEEQHIQVIYPNYALSGVEIMTLPPEVDKVFIDETRRVFFDVGGDPIGATALGRYYPQFMQSGYEMLYIINVRRPLSGNARDIIEMLREIEENSRLRVTGLINNSNLARETTVQDLIDGQEIVEEVSRETGIPIRYVCGTGDVIEQFLAKTPYKGEVLPMNIFMRPAWLDSTAD